VPPDGGGGVPRGRYPTVSCLSDLLALAATDLLSGNDVEAELEGGDLVVIDFREWYQSLKGDSHVRCTIEEFWEDIQSLAKRTEGDRLVLYLGFGIPVKLGAPFQLIEPEKYIEFYFKADLKHSDTQGYATESRKALPFLGAVEDAVRSTFR